VEGLVRAGASRRPNGLLVDSTEAPNASLALAAAGLGPVTVSRPDYVFDVSCTSFNTLRSKVF
jgi:ATP phosphoribosyltransferase